MNEDGTPYEPEWLGTAAPEEIARLEARVGPLTDDYREAARLIGRAEGFGSVDRFDFAAPEPWGFAEILLEGAVFAEDGLGNAWIADIAAGPPTPVYFVCHDPPVIVLEARSFVEFLAIVATWNESGGDAEEDPYLTLVLADAGGLDADEVEAPELKTFLNDLGPDWVLYDLSGASPGEGFLCAGSEDAQRVARLGKLPVFAVERRADD